MQNCCLASRARLDGSTVWYYTRTYMYNDRLTLRTANGPAQCAIELS